LRSIHSHRTFPIPSKDYGPNLPIRRDLFSSYSLSTSFVHRFSSGFCVLHANSSLPSPYSMARHSSYYFSFQVFCADSPLAPCPLLTHLLLVHRSLNFPSHFNFIALLFLTFPKSHYFFPTHRRSSPPSIHKRFFFPRFREYIIDPRPLLPR